MATKRKQNISGKYLLSMDWWVAVIVFVVLAILLVLLPATVWGMVPWWQATVEVIIILIMLFSVIDSAFFTFYEFEADNLVISSQLRRFTFPYQSMRKISHSNLLSLWTFGSRKRFALSSRGYTIQLEGQRWSQISISPLHKDQFMQTLLAHIDKQRSKHLIVKG